VEDIRRKEVGQIEKKRSKGPRENWERTRGLVKCPKPKKGKKEKNDWRKRGPGKA